MRIAASSRITPCRQSANRRALSENTSGRPRPLIIYEGSRKGQTYSVCLPVCLFNYGGKSHAVNPFFADVSRALRFCASVQTPRKSGLVRRCPRPSFRTLRRLATPQSPDNSAPRQTGIVRYNKFTIDSSAIQGFCVNPLYFFGNGLKKSGFFSPRAKHFSENLAKTPCLDCWLTSSKSGRPRTLYAESPIPAFLSPFSFNIHPITT